MALNRDCLLSQAPELSSFLSNISRNRSKFCTVCLRTEQERRLVKPVAFRKFVKATKIGKSWGNINVCYMCERQASNAFKFHRAATFAQTIRVVFANLVVSRKFEDGAHVKEIKRIQKKMNGTQLTQELELELSQVRKITQFLETEVLVIDSSGMQVTPSNDDDDVFLIPDDPDSETDQTPLPEQVSLIVETSKSPGPQADTRLDGGKRTNWIPDSNTGTVGSAGPSENEHCIILDDDEELDICKNEPGLQKELEYTSKTLASMLSTKSEPPPLKIENILDQQLMPSQELIKGLLNTPQINNQNFFIHPILMTDGMLSVPSLKASIVNGQLVAIDDLVVTQNTMSSNDMPKNAPSPPPLIKAPIFDDRRTNTNLTNINKISTNTNTSSINMNETNANPSSANVSKSRTKARKSSNNKNKSATTANKSSANIDKSASNANTSLTDTCKSAMNANINNSASNANISSTDMNKSAINTNLSPDGTIAGKRTVETQFSEHLRDILLNGIEAATPQKKAKLPENNDKKNVDWEDKIPMDVISFIDAVDPNAPILPPVAMDEPPTMGSISEVRSLAGRDMESPTTEMSEVIDLC